MRFAAALLFCSAALLAQQNDWLIVPGKRLGPITSETNRKDLDRLFGRRNVVDRDVDLGEGPGPATVVYPRDPTSELVVFRDESHIGSVFICFDHANSPCKWHTKEGVTVGTSFSKLENLNGRPYTVLGWGTDQGCVITSWEGGALAREFGDHGNFGLTLTLDIKAPLKGLTAQQIRDLDELDRLRRPPRSSDPAFRRLNPKVDRVAFNFPSR